MTPLFEIAKEFIQGLYLQYPSEEIQNAIHAKFYSETQLVGLMNSFHMKEKDYYIEKISDSAITVFLINPFTQNYERIHNTIPFVPVASTTYQKNIPLTEQKHHGKRGDKTPLHKLIHQKEYIGDHWMIEYIYIYSPVFSS